VKTNNYENKGSNLMRTLGFAFFIVGAVVSLAFAADLAEFQLIVPAPDPVNAGEKVTFQVITVNRSGTAWGSGTCELEVEVYDKDKVYLGKSDKAKNKEDVAPGGTILDFVTFNVPPNAGGAYYYKVSYIQNTQRLAYSDFQPLTITPITVIAPEVKPPKDVQIGGNATIAYKNESKDNWKNYVGNISLNVLGSIYQKSVVCNVYTYHTPEKTFDLYNFILDYRSSKFDVTFGDIMPNFSALSLSNAGMRGVMPVIRTGPATTSIVAARSVDPKEAALNSSGTITANGNFARYVYAVQEKIDIFYDNSVSINYVTSSDDKNSILNTGTDVYPLQNKVMGVNFMIGSFKYATFKCDYARSAHSTDTVNMSPEVTDAAYKASVESRLGIFSIKANYQHVGTDFYSLGSPTIVKDRNNYDFMTGVGSPKIGSLNLSYNQAVDNLKNDPSKIITTQSIYSANTNLTLPKWPILSVGYAINDVGGLPVNSTDSVKTLNNKTNIITAGVSYSLPWWINSISIQKSGYKDYILANSTSEVALGISRNDKDTMSGTYSATFIMGDRISLNLGITNTKITNLYDLSVNVMDTYSSTLNIKVIKEKLVLALWGNQTLRNDNSLTAPAKTTTQVSNTELTYYFTQQFSWTVGGGVTNYQDTLTAINSYNYSKISTRIGLGF